MSAICIPCRSIARMALPPGTTDRPPLRERLADLVAPMRHLRCPDHLASLIVNNRDPTGFGPCIKFDAQWRNLRIGPGFLQDEHQRKAAQDSCLAALE